MATLKDLDKAVDSKTFNPIYLFTGEETGIISEYVTELKSQFKTVVETDDLDHVIEDSKYNSIFGGRKLYLMRDTGLFNKKAENKFIQFLAKLLKQKFNVCIFVEQKVDKNLPQTQALGDPGIVVFDKLTEAQLMAFVTQVLAKNDKKMIKDITRYFVDQCDYNYDTIINELTKLINYVDKKQITLDDVKAVVSRSSNAVVFDLVTFIVKQNYIRALEMYDMLILRKEAPLVILLLIYRQLKLLYQVKLLRAEGYQIADIADACDSKPFIIEKTMNLCNFSTDKLLRLMLKCSEYDFKIKTGQIKDTLAVKLLILYSSI